MERFLLRSILKENARCQVVKMNFKQYQATLEAFNDRGVTEWDNIIREQDRLITALVERGASIVGWKVVQKDVIFVSPIFDCQVYTCISATIPKKAIRGTEIEVCFQLDVPQDSDNIAHLVASLDTYAAVELIRPEINAVNHPACDFYYDYGVMISHHPVAGDLQFKGGNGQYEFAFNMEELAEEKRRIAQLGIEECIRRGYGGKRYFFITGTINGLVPTQSSIGMNTLYGADEHNPFIHFEVI